MKTVKSYPPSVSEDRGVAAVPESARDIYSVGVSTAGAAEVRFIARRPDRRVVATTVDEQGFQYTKALLNSADPKGQIQLKIEDVASVLPYADDTFDYVYARLVLHYLSREQLIVALSELCRILRPSGKIFIVVRSNEVLKSGNTTDREYSYDKKTGMHTYVSQPSENVREVRSRFFHDESSLCNFMVDAGFTIESSDQYYEDVYHDYERKVAVDHPTHLLEVIGMLRKP